MSQERFAGAWGRSIVVPAVLVLVTATLAAFGAPSASAATVTTTGFQTALLGSFTYSNANNSHGAPNGVGMVAYLGNSTDILANGVPQPSMTPVANRDVDLYIQVSDSGIWEYACSGKTNAQGIASCTVATPNPYSGAAANAHYQIDAWQMVFSGDSQYQQSTDYGTVPGTPAVSPTKGSIPIVEDKTPPKPGCGPAISPSDQATLGDLLTDGGNCQLVHIEQIFTEVDFGLTTAFLSGGYTFYTTLSGIVQYGLESELVNWAISGWAQAAEAGLGATTQVALDNSGTVANYLVSKVNAGQAMQVGSGTTLDNVGTIQNFGTITDDSAGGKGAGTIVNTGTIVGGGTVSGDGQGTNGGLLITGNNYTLDFNVNGGPGAAPAALTVFAPDVSDAEVTLPVPAAPAGTEFVGWYTAASGGTAVTADTQLSTVMPTGPSSLMLYAHYTQIPTVTLYVDQAGGSSTCIAPGTGACPTIAGAIAAATGGHYAGYAVTIDIAGGVYYERDTIAAQGLQSLTLVGSGSGATIVSGQTHGTVFDVTPGDATVTLSDTAIDDGQWQTSSSDPHGGGGVVDHGGTVVLSGDTLDNDTAPGGSGGAVLNDDGTIVLTADTLSNDSAQVGGGVFNDGTPSTGSVQLTNDTFVDDSASGSGAEGGAILSSGGTVAMLDDTLAYNSATGGGSGLVLTNSASASVANSIFDAAGCIISAGTSVTDAGYNVESDDSCGLGSNSVVNSSRIDLAATLAGNDSVGPETLAFTSTDSSAHEEVPLPAAAAPGTQGCTVTTDELGLPRPGVPGHNCDAGAFEAQGATTIAGVKQATLYVNPSGTSTTCLGSGANACPTIADALTAATGASTYNGDALTIELAPGTYDEINDVNATQLASLTIAGAGAGIGGTTVSGLGHGTVFSVATGDATVTLTGMAIDDGQWQLTPPSQTSAGNVLGGGGVYNEGGTVLLSDDELDDDTAPGGLGGAVASNEGTTVLSGDTFSGDSAQFGGAVAGAEALQTLTNDTFVDDSATGSSAEGGAIYVAKGTTALVDDTLADDTANSGAGLAANDAAVTVADSILDSAGCLNQSGSAIVDGGFNVESDNSCGFGSQSLVNNANIDLASAMGANGTVGPATLAIGSDSSAFEEVPLPSSASAGLQGCSLKVDERGQTRPGAPNESCDAGALEFEQPVTTAPGAPTGVAGSSGDGLVTVSWSAPNEDGGSAITGYLATAQDTTDPGHGGQTCSPSSASATTCTMTGLTNGDSYTFTVMADNGVGPSSASAPSSPVVPATVPAAPGDVVVASGEGQATVWWSAPDDGGSAVTGYQVVAQDQTSFGSGFEGCTPAAATATSCTVTGLTDGDQYTFAVSARNAVGTGATQTSGPVTPGPASTSSMLISELRLQGTGAADDSYVDLFNGTGSAVSLNGWTLLEQYGNGQAGSVPLAGDSLAPGQHWLLASGDASLTNLAKEDQDLALPSGSGGLEGVALENPDGVIVDQVGYAGSVYANGTGLTAPTVGVNSSAAQIAWVRTFLDGIPVNSSDNAADFQLVAGDANVNSYGPVTAVYGSPDPLASGSPSQIDMIGQSYLLDPTVAEGSAPNLVYTPPANGQPESATNPGLLVISRKVTNVSTDLAITRLWIHITGLSTYGEASSPVYGDGALLSAISQPAGSVTTSSGPASLAATTLLSPAGGLNSELQVALPTETGNSTTGLAPGQSVNVSIGFDVYHGGGFALAYNVEDDLKPYVTPGGSSSTSSSGSPSAGGSAAAPPAQSSAGPASLPAPTALAGSVTATGATLTPQTAPVESSGKRHIKKKHQKKHVKNRKREHKKKGKHARASEFEPTRHRHVKEKDA